MQNIEVQTQAGFGADRAQITGYQLKWIAILTMAVDHTAACVLEYALVYGGAGLAHPWLVTLYYVMRGIGRLAFPLFIFLLAEGFHYTHSREKYLLRLGIFCLVSDIPFDLALFLTNRQVRSGEFFTLQNQSVFFTLFFGFLCMYFLDRVIERFFDQNRAICILLCILICAGGFLLGELFRTDYGGAGVAAVIAAYFLRETGIKPLEMFGIVCVLGILSSLFEWVALIDVVFVALYRGKEGRKGSRWFFYFFYPCHLFALFVIRMLMFPHI